MDVLPVDGRRELRNLGQAGLVLAPLLLDDDEAVAVTVGLRTSATSSVAGIEEASLRALAKVEQVLPSRLRHRVETLEGAIVAMPPRGGPIVDTSVLTAVAAAIRAAESLRFDYLSHHGIPSLGRTVEPHRLVCWGRRWYLVGWDRDRAGWRTLRADRMSLRAPNGPRFTHREPPRRGCGGLPPPDNRPRRLALSLPVDHARPRLADHRARRRDHHPNRRAHLPAGVGLGLTRHGRAGGRPARRRL